MTFTFLLKKKNLSFHYNQICCLSFKKSKNQLFFFHLNYSNIFNRSNLKMKYTFLFFKRNKKYVLYLNSLMKRNKSLLFVKKNNKFRSSCNPFPFSANLLFYISTFPSICPKSIQVLIHVKLYTCIKLCNYKYLKYSL